MNNSNLSRAKRLKNDEFYTIYEDIEKECIHYKKYFTDKTIYCNCDDYEQSNFVKYFTDNFQNFGLKKLIATCYSKEGKGKYFEYNGQNKIVYNLDSNGDFRSVENKKILEEADIVITNPPFSLFREYIAQLVEYRKQFLIIGNMNAITYKEIFPLIKDNKLWLGISSPNEYKLPNGEITKQVNGLCRWFTNLTHDRRNMPFDLYMKYSNEYFPKYDNYDAIEVSKTCDIPMDYDGVMGVPITFLDKYCPEQFEILGIANSARWIGDFPCLTIINGKKIYNRILIRHKR